MNPSPRPKSYALAVTALISLASVVFLGKSYESGLRGIDSNIHAAVSMSVTQGPGLLPVLPIAIRNFTAAAPRLPGSPLDPDRIFNDHPFFVFWLNGLIMRALGPSAWSARLLTGAFSVGSVLLTLALGQALAGPALGMLAALLIIFSRDFILTSATVSLDTALVFFILLTFYLWIRKRWLALGMAAGVGLWVKTPIVLLVFPVALIQLVLARNSKAFKQTLPRLVGAGVLAVCVGSLIWIYTGIFGGWEVVHDYWARQFWGTAVGGRGAQAQGWDWGRFFFYNLRTGFLPGLPLLLVAFVQITRKRRWLEPSVQIPVLAVGVLGLVVTALRFKMGHYFTPIFPFLALLSAHSLAPQLESRLDRFYTSVATVSLALFAFLLITPVSFGPEAFVALRRFAPFIQTRGGCDDTVVLVPGGEPVGSELDYKLFLNFYTGRKIQVLGCEQLSASIETAAPHVPEWVILSDENLKRCLSPTARSHYPTALLVGTQYLLSRDLTTLPAIDLTPIELDHQAVTDCQAPRYPQDIWHKYLSSPSSHATN